MTRPTPDEISATAAQLAFGHRIIQNNLRALVVEVIVDYALKPDWRHCSEDWKGWDFEHKDGTRLEVKQSALKQTWVAPRTRSLPRFDIRERTGYWENGNSWVGQAGRYAQIYLFAYHRADGEAADQRDPLQWKFYVVRAARLPPTRTVGLSTVASLSPMLNWEALFGVMERERLQLRETVVPAQGNVSDPV